MFRSGSEVGGRILVERVPEHPSVRAEVFGLRGESGRDRYTGLLQLLHTLRSPDVGNRIDEGRLPQILSDALPPLSENLLTTAGDRLDGLTETRTAQEHLEETREHLEQFHEVYRRYATHVLHRRQINFSGVTTNWTRWRSIGQS